MKIQYVDLTYNALWWWYESDSRKIAAVFIVFYKMRKSHLSAYSKHV